MNKENQLIETIVKGIQEKKGHNIVIADLSNIEGAIAKHFVICGRSNCRGGSRDLQKRFTRETTALRWT